MHDPLHIPAALVMPQKLRPAAHLDGVPHAVGACRVKPDRSPARRKPTDTVRQRSLPSRMRCATLSASIHTATFAVRMLKTERQGIYVWLS